MDAQGIAAIITALAALVAAITAFVSHFQTLPAVKKTLANTNGALAAMSEANRKLTLSQATREELHARAVPPVQKG